MHLMVLMKWWYDFQRWSECNKHDTNMNNTYTYNLIIIILTINSLYDLHNIYIINIIIQWIKHDKIPITNLYTSTIDHVLMSLLMYRF